MARSQTRLALLLILVMFIAGCVSEPTPDWGTDDGEMKVTLSDGKAKIVSKLGTKDYDKEHVLLGCDNSPITITGLLLTSTIYSEHTNAEGLAQAVGAAVIIHQMSWSDAANVEDGTAGRIGLKDWTEPLYPTEKVGNKLGDNEGVWIIIGIIPATENVAYGLNIVEEWHQAIRITGFIVTDDDMYDWPVDEDNEDECSLKQYGGTGDAMVIEKIETEIGVVSSDGDDDDEWALGDTDIFGAWTFILIFIVIAGGGGFGLFIFSTMMVRQGATTTAKTLLGREGFAKALEMRRDLKKAKKEKIEDSEETRAVPKEETYSPSKPKRGAEEPVESIGGFSLDNILSSAHTIGGESTGISGGGVVISDDAAEMSRVQSATSPAKDTSKQQYSNIDSQSYSAPSSNVMSSRSEPSTKRSHFSSTISPSSSKATIPGSAAQPTKAAKPMKRRAVKKRKVEPEYDEPAPSQRSPSVADDDFDDFSI